MPNAWQIKRRLSEAVNTHDLHRVLGFYSPDAVLVSPTGIAEGHEQIAWVYEQLFKGFPDLHQTIWMEVPCDDPVVAEWTFTGTHTGSFLLPDGREAEGTERRIIVRGSCVSYVADDMIITHREYFDQLEMYSQLGFGLARLDLHAA
ncbi:MULTISPECIES: ester cyclase [unclassified Streptosporangium]|uniref:ester cyclase n=1 Tax=unclassified Streptosporangium TaxID=2632669 RepID=UPI002E29A760|nr:MULTISPECIES: ester cyclase [unclassified Streptosporangium]